MMRHVVTLAILLASVILYVRGFSSLSLITVIAAIALEVWFWARLVRGRPTEAQRIPQQR